MKKRHKVFTLEFTGETKKLSLIFIYSGEFAEKVIRNLINDPSFCKSCGIYCDSCKYNAYSFVQNIRAATQLPSPAELPAFIDNPEKYMPRKISKANLCIASGLHKDLLLELPAYLNKNGVEGLIVPIEDFNEVPSGLRKQVEERCMELSIESAFPKPFCSLEADEKNKPLISQFVNGFNVGKPKLEISTETHGKYEVISSTVVRQSAPCGSTWYVAKKILGTRIEMGILYDTIAKAHHSYPCTATMNVDPELKEPILHIGGYIIREAVEKALEKPKKGR
ncbi:MAG: DUF166 domain-containing protein [Candidatus Bathyarchaeales archaeon]